jgi:hypothetical protein
MTTSFNPEIKPSLTRLAVEAKLHEKMIEHGLVPSCINCEHWGENYAPDGVTRPRGKAKEEICRLYKARPPAETIVLGCTSWVWDLPF